MQPSMLYDLTGQPWTGSFHFTMEPAPGSP
jgi:hypothetical protein